MRSPINTDGGAFSTDHLRSNLKSHSIRGGVVTIVSQGLRLLLQMASTVVLARLLTPQDFGLIAMVTAVTGFVALFKDLGLSLATVQSKDITHAQISALFWINAGAGVALTALTCTLAPLIGWFYHEPRLVLITIVSAAGFAIGGLSVQHQALLQRQMRFLALAVVNIVSLGGGILTAIVSVKLGAGYWALVFMQLMSGLVYCVGVWWACRWFPSLPERGVNIRTLVTFGGEVTGFNILNCFARNLDNVLIGMRWGSWHLGLYSKAYNLFMMPLSQISGPISTVVIPALSHLQSDPERFRRYYLRVLSLVALLTLPAFALSVVVAEEMINLVLGSQWGGAASIFRLLAISGFVQPICNSTGWLFIATGQTRRLFKWGCFASVILAGSFFVGLPFGAQGVALCYTISFLVVTCPCVIYATKGTAVVPVDVFHAVKKQALAATVAMLLAWFLKVYWISQLPTWGILTACAIIFLIVYSLFVFSFFKIHADLKGLLQAFFSNQRGKI